MKVLFLDINGVLCLGYSGKLDSTALTNLRRICDETGCHVVLSSSWRSSQRAIEVVNQALKNHQIPVLIGKTGHKGNRAAEILAWMEEWNAAVEAKSLEKLQIQSPKYPVVIRESVYFEEFALPLIEPKKISAWVSVDDEPTLKRKIPQNLVMTNTMKGLTAEDADRAIQILTGEKRTSFFGLFAVKS